MPVGARRWAQMSDAEMLAVLRDDVVREGSDSANRHKGIVASFRRRFGTWPAAVEASGIQRPPAGPQAHACARECCPETTTNPLYCSRSCAQTVNSTGRDRWAAKRKMRECARCGEGFLPLPSKNPDGSYHHNASTACPACQNEAPGWRKSYVHRKTGRLVESGVRDNRTLGEIFDACRTRQQAFAVIRKDSRRVWAESGLPSSCEVCGYEPFISVHHIRGVMKFPMDTPLGIVNDITNLAGLCATHHAEADAGWRIFPEGWHGITNPTERVRAIPSGLPVWVIAIPKSPARDVIS